MLHSATLAALAAVTVFASDRDPTTQRPGMIEVAASAPAEAPAPSESSNGKREQRYCVEQQTTGSILTHRKCLTRAQWIEKEGVDPLAPRK